MTLSIIVAISKNNIIGKDNGMPWHLPADLKYFRQVTTGHHIIMGRKTFESIGGGKPLPNRVSIIVTHQRDYRAEGCIVAHSLHEAIAKTDEQDEVFVIGGKQLYEQALPLADTLYITRIHQSIEGDTAFPIYNQQDWILSRNVDYSADEKNAYNLSFQVFEREGKLTK